MIKNIKQINKQWRLANKEKIYTNNKNRKLKLKRIKGSHTFKEWELLKKQCNYKCVVCGIHENKLKKEYKGTQFTKLTKDHIIPISKGGSNYITNIRPLCVSCNSKKRDEKAFKIIITTGVWDLLHAGHINIFKIAKQLGDYLIVGVSTNKLIKNYKKINPILNCKQRKKVIRAIKYVDAVVTQTKLIDIQQFKDLKADLFVIGDDWKDRKDIEGLNWLRKNNKVKFIPYTKELSTTKIKNKIVKEWKIK